MINITLKIITLIEGYLKKIGILTAGGDCPGLNAIIRSVVISANLINMEVIGFLNGFAGLSGPAIKPIGVASVYKIHQSVKNLEKLLILNIFNVICARKNNKNM